jgi:dipeptidyl aminopeptidase/acylaminoacyl peptidase
MVTVSPYGSWKSPITADLLAESAVRLSYPMVAGERRDTLYWVESRPAEKGRLVIVRRRPGGGEEEVFGPGFSARTLVHEYGGRCYTVHGETVYFSNFEDQRLHRVLPGGLPEPITPEPPLPRSVRYAAPTMSRNGRFLYCIRERHGAPGVAEEVLNDLVVLAGDGEAEPRVVAGGHDFYSFPTLRGDGRRLAWTCWDHPRMPWDGTELWESELGADGLPFSSRLVAGGEAESITQPRYDPAGRLHFVSDRTGWWNLYSDDGEGGVALAPMVAEFAVPDWVFGASTYAFLPDGALVASYASGGFSHLGVWRRPGPAGSEPIETPFDHLAYVAAAPGPASVVAVAGSSLLPDAVVEIGIPSGEVSVVKASGEPSVDDRYLAQPEPIEFPTGDGLRAHALFYPPLNPDFEAPPGERPPLIVSSHGGPTSAFVPGFKYEVQYWTSRGFAVVEVNYGGSAGYGREYRERLKGLWGVVDLDDCVNAALFLASSGRADRNRLLIRGGSAGGFTTLCALTFRDVFAAGASYYGVGDLGALAEHTHKFESQYMVGLVGPWPSGRAIYEERSPAFHTDLLETPIILFQGLEDAVVPPRQAEVMVEALRVKGVPFAYVAYEGEQHGFRQAPNIKRSAEAELYFYSRVLGLQQSDEVEPVEIEHSEALGVRTAE